MDLRHLKYFVAVADEQNFTRAAEKLHISQPPLSRQIQQLEEELGLPLFERGTGPVRLTEAERFFYTHATRLLEQAAEAIRTTRRIAQAERRLAIGFVSSSMYGALPELLRRFRAQRPQVQLVLLEMSTIEQIDALKTGRIDVGFGRIRLDDPALKREVLREEPLVLAIPLSHELADSTEPVSLAEVARFNNLVYPRSPRPSYADQVLSLFRDMGLEPAGVHEVQELQTALGLVAAGIGVCLVPFSVQRLRPDEVMYRPMREPHLASPIILSMRLHDQSDELLVLRGLIPGVYRDRKELGVKIT